MKAELMVVKPDKIRGIKAKFEDTTVKYDMETAAVRLTSKAGGVEQGVLKEVRWVSRDMTKLELIMDKMHSRIIRLKAKDDVFRWVEPVCESLKTHKKSK